MCVFARGIGGESSFARKEKPRRITFARANGIHDLTPAGLQLKVWQAKGGDN
jgi:hypothetical protein